MSEVAELLFGLKSCRELLKNNITISFGLAATLLKQILSITTQIELAIKTLGRVWRIAAARKKNFQK